MTADQAYQASRHVHTYAMLCANECRKRFGLSQGATRALYESMLPQKSQIGIATGRSAKGA